MIGRPPPPAAPKSDPPYDRLCHSKVAGQDTACRVVERAFPTLRRPKTQDKCQSLRDRGSPVGARVHSLRPVEDGALAEHGLLLHRRVQCRIVQVARTQNLLCRSADDGQVQERRPCNMRGSAW